MILLCLSKKAQVVGATVPNTYRMSVENIVNFVTGKKMFFKE